MKKNSPSTDNLAVFAVGMIILNIILIYVMNYFPKSVNPSVQEFIIRTIILGMFVGVVNIVWAYFSQKIKLK